MGVALGLSPFFTYVEVHMIKRFFKEEEENLEDVIEVIFTPEAWEEVVEETVVPRRIEKRALGDVFMREAPNGRKKGILRRGSFVTVVAEKDGWSETSQGLYIKSEFLEE